MKAGNCLTAFRLIDSQDLLLGNATLSKPYFLLRQRNSLTMGMVNSFPCSSSAKWCGQVFPVLTCYSELNLWGFFTCCCRFCFVYATEFLDRGFFKNLNSIIINTNGRGKEVSHLGFATSLRVLGLFRNICYWDRATQVMSRLWFFCFGIYDQCDFELQENLIHLCWKSIKKIFTAGHRKLQILFSTHLKIKRTVCYVAFSRKYTNLL